MNTSNKVLLGAAVAGILSVGTMSLAPIAQAAEKPVKCMGMNSCKGKSDCKSDKNSCKGTNGCKGHGFMKMSKADCEVAKKKATDGSEKKEDAPKS